MGFVSETLHSGRRYQKSATWQCAISLVARVVLFYCSCVSCFSVVRRLCRLAAEPLGFACQLSLAMIRTVEASLARLLRTDPF